MIRRDEPCKHEDKAFCQGHSLCGNPKAEMSLGCSSYRKEVFVVGPRLVGGGT